MAAEIIFDADRGMEEQMREVLDLADPDSGDVAAINWYPRPNKPHGGVVQVPEHIAERHAAHLDERRSALAAAEPEAPVVDETSDTPPADQAPAEEDAPPPPPAETGSSRRRRAASTTDTSEDGGNA